MTDGESQQAGAAGLLSVIVPCFNEATTIHLLLARVLAGHRLGLELEIIVVDDGSTDGSAQIVERLAGQVPNLRLFRQPANRGKSAALHRGFAEARGEIGLIPDADPEYRPIE